jgi:hypothetical protein
VDFQPRREFRDVLILGNTYLTFSSFSWHTTKSLGISEVTVGVFSYDNEITDGPSPLASSGWGWGRGGLVLERERQDQRVSPPRTEGQVDFQGPMM